MHGNLWEWCSDWHGDYPSRDVTDPKGPSVGKERVHRGGCYLVEGIKCRSAARNWDPPGDTYYYLGFRVVMEARKYGERWSGSSKVTCFSSPLRDFLMEQAIVLPNH